MGKFRQIFTELLASDTIIVGYYRFNVFLLLFLIQLFHKDFDGMGKKYTT